MERFPAPTRKRRVGICVKEVDTSLAAKGRPMDAEVPVEGPEAVERLLIEGVVREALREMDAPHLVVCHDPTTGLVSHQGPYATGYEAVVAAEMEAIDVAMDAPELSYSVAPLLPPVQRPE